MAARIERQLLPKMRQRALEQMERCVMAWKARALNAGQIDLARRWGAIERTLACAPGEARPRLDGVASIWLDLAAPLWPQALQRLRRLALLDALLLAQPLHIEAIEQRFRSLDAELGLDERIKAAIIGVPPASWPAPPEADDESGKAPWKTKGSGRPRAGGRLPL